jgi:hypothetical protein
MYDCVVSHLRLRTAINGMACCTITEHDIDWAHMFEQSQVTQRPSHCMPVRMPCVILSTVAVYFKVSLPVEFWDAEG